MNINAAMKHGSEMEPHMRFLLNMTEEAFKHKSGVIDIRWSGRRQIGRKNFEVRFDFQPTCVESDNFGASLDGLDEQARMWLEIKAPYKGKCSYNWNCATTTTKNLRRRIPSSHWWQLVHQAMCLPPAFEHCLYAICVIDEDSYEVSWDEEIEFESYERSNMEFSPERRFRLYCIPIHRAELEKDIPALRRAWQAFLDGEDSDDAYTVRRTRNMLEGETVRAARDRWRTAGLCRDCGDSAEGAEVAPSMIDDTECRPCYERRSRKRNRLARRAARDS